jgi:hypothetical protein
MAELKLVDILAFTKWLRARGSQILAPTNEYEVLRFTTAQGIGLIYSSRTKPISHINGPAHTAVSSFYCNAPWSAEERTLRIGGTAKQQVKNSILARDGDRCIYCEKQFSDSSPATLEHLFPVRDGGTNHINNLALACDACNLATSDMGAAEKIRYAKARLFPN